MGLSKTEIALRIGASRRSIQREIQRGWVCGLLTSELEAYNTYIHVFMRARMGHIEMDTMVENKEVLLAFSY